MLYSSLARFMMNATAVASLVLLSACAGPRGPAGPSGPPGPPGPTGAPGALQGYEIVVGETPLNDNARKQLRVDCPEGKRATGAGWSVLDPTDAFYEGRATYFQPAYDGSYWLVNARNDSSFATDWKLRVRVVCVSAPPPAP